MQPPYLLFLGDVQDQLAAKTAQGIVHWRPEWVVGQLKLEGCKADVGVPDVTIADAAAKGVKTLVVGVVNSGGTMPGHWADTIVSAIGAGMDVMGGLHVRLGSVPAIKEAAEAKGAALLDVRHPIQTFKTGTGVKRAGKRVLAVGTDCSVGKKYTALALEKTLKERGQKADFRATGQTGIMIATRGVAIDALAADFVAGAVEWLSPDNDDDHYDCIEGQGSLFHPAFAGVSLGLLHGAQPDHLILCHEPTRTHMRGLPHRPLPGLKECLDLNLHLAKLTNPDVRPLGVSINTAALSKDEAEAYLKSVEDELGLPTVDHFLTGMDRIADALP